MEQEKLLINSSTVSYKDLSFSDFGLSINELPQPVNFEPSTIEHSDSRGTLRLNLSHNKRIGRECKNGIALLSRFKKLIKLNLSNNKLSSQGAIALTDYVLYSDSCHMLEGLDLSNNDIISTNVANLALKVLHHDKIKSTSFFNDYVSYNSLFCVGVSGQSLEDVEDFAEGLILMEDFNYNQQYFSGIYIDLSDIPMDYSMAIDVLRILNDSNRVQEVDMSNTCKIEFKSMAESLKRAFKHDKIHHRIAIGDQPCEIVMEVPPY